MTSTTRTTCAALALAMAIAVGLFMTYGSVFVTTPSTSLQTQANAHAESHASFSGFTNVDPIAAAPSAVCGFAGLAVCTALLMRMTPATRASTRGAEGHLVALSAFENELGVQAPVGFWDPLGLSKDGDAETFKRRRITELKHGRVSMLACIGYIVPEYFKWPGLLSPSADLKFQDVPTGLAALSKVPLNGWLQVVIFAGFYEFPTYNSDAAPGDLGWKAITSSDPETLKRKLNAELANGRLAMMAIIGMFFQDGLTGSAWGDWANYTASPLRAPAEVVATATQAFENELGVQPPVGFWDPLGLSSDGNAEDFKRRRTTELKHGRISMIACIGYITPEYFKWSGDLSPSLGIRFADIPNGLGALSKIPSFGIAQWVLFCGVVEVGYFRQDDSRDAGDYANGGILGVPNGTGPIKDPESRKRKLSAEIANGRLAMMAIIGMFFQDGLTGSAWGDWSLYQGSPLR